MQIRPRDADIGDSCLTRSRSPPLISKCHQITFVACVTLTDSALLATRKLDGLKGVCGKNLNIRLNFAWHNYSFICYCKLPQLFSLVIDFNMHTWEGSAQGSRRPRDRAIVFEAM